jgi:ubiquinone biosynthesis protein Coq4
METNATLREAIKEFNSVNSKYFSDRDISLEAQEFFKCHDIAHVVFGCDTSIVGEGKVKVWSIFGTTLGYWKHIQGYAEADAFSLFRQYSWSHVLKSIFKLLTKIPQAIFRARRMTKPWTWSSYEPYLDMPLTQIREEFNIKPL